MYAIRSYYGQGLPPFECHPEKPLLYQLIFMLATGSVVVLGVNKGIEKVSKVLMPVLGEHCGRFCDGIEVEPKTTRLVYVRHLLVRFGRQQILVVLFIV